MTDYRSSIGKGKQTGAVITSPYAGGGGGGDDTTDDTSTTDDTTDTTTTTDDTTTTTDYDTNTTTTTDVKTSGFEFDAAITFDETHLASHGSDARPGDILHGTVRILNELSQTARKTVDLVMNGETVASKEFQLQEGEKEYWDVELTTPNAEKMVFHCEDWDWWWYVKSPFQAKINYVQNKRPRPGEEVTVSVEWKNLSSIGIDARWVVVEEGQRTNVFTAYVDPGNVKNTVLTTRVPSDFSQEYYDLAINGDGPIGKANFKLEMDYSDTSSGGDNGGSTDDGSGGDTSDGGTGSDDTTYDGSNGGGTGDDGQTQQPSGGGSLSYIKENPGVALAAGAIGAYALKNLKD